MSHDDIVFNGNTFTENLDNILLKFAYDFRHKDSADPGITLQSRATIDQNDFGAQDFFQTRNFYATDSNPLRDWESFQNDIANYLFNKYGTGFEPDLQATKDTILERFLTDFKVMIGYPGSDWDVLGPGIHGTGTDLDGFPRSVDDDLIEEYFKRSFSHFLSNYPYILDDPDNPGSKGTIGTPPNNLDAADRFFENWVNFMTRTAEFRDGTYIPTNDGNIRLDRAAYEQIYNALFPQESGESATDFQTRFAERLRKFWKEQALANGAQSPDNAWFIPSHSFDEWMEELREEFIRLGTVRSTQLFTVSTPATERVLVIDRILRLLIQMIDILQRISASQAQRLSFLTTWQKAYTELVADVPQFAQGDGSPLGSSDKRSKAFRNNDVNPAMNSELEKVRARRSVVQDEAKQMQTTINQSQDASNQQTQMATSLIQQLSTILSQIFR